MFRARDAIIVAGLMAILSVMLSLLSLMKPPDSDGWNADSYGTRARGHRALYELLGAMKVPVKRRLTPPVDIPVRDQLFVMWGPEENFVEMEPAYLYRLHEWMKAGGEIVVAPAPEGKQSIFSRAGRNPTIKHVHITDALGVAGIKIATVDLEKESVPEKPPAPPKNIKNQAKANEEDEDKELYELDESDGFMAQYKTDWKPRAFQSVVVRTEGDLALPAADVRTLSVPSGIMAVLDEKSTATATGTLRMSGDKKYALAATYRVGAGRLTVVADPSLFMNEALGRDDNAVFAARLFAHPGREVVFDEFYHGLTVRGNPLWLATRFPYGLLAILTIAWVSLWAWRAAIHLGPPLRDATVARRSVADYVDAMGRLFLRAGSHKFLMRELRDGALWSIGHQLNLPPGVEAPDRVLAALQRRDPARADRLRTALAAVDQVMVSKRKPSKRELIEAAGKVNACL